MDTTRSPKDSLRFRFTKKINEIYFRKNVARKFREHSKFDPLNDFCTASFILILIKCENLRAFDFPQLLNKNMFKRTLKIAVLITVLIW